MSDEGFDPCECIWNHKLAMQRLLSILRQSQAYCTDSECLSVSRLPGPREGLSASNLLMPLLMVAFIVLMIALRPRGLRHVRNNAVKNEGNGSDSSDDPPTPPPTVN